MALLIKIDEPYSSASLDPTPLFAADTFAGGRGMGPLTYEVNDESVTITSCDPAAIHVDIPASIENLPVTQVGRSAFRHCVELGAVSLPETLLALGDYAFMDAAS